jgi:hypothetical protein
MKSSKMIMRLAILVLVILILRQLMTRGVSGMRGLVTSSDAGEPGDLFMLKNKIDCTASGFNKNSAYYSRSLTPGGLCGDMDFVRTQERGYTIDGGIGGSLLS